MMVKAILASEGFVELPRACAPSGVYVLLAQGEVLYVGQAQNVYQRITAHLNTKRKGQGNATRIAASLLSPGDHRNHAIPFDQVLVRYCAVSELDRIEYEYIERYHPKYNVRNNNYDRSKFRVNVHELADKLGIDLWNRPLKTQGTLKRRRVA